MVKTSGKGVGGAGKVMLAFGPCASAIDTTNLRFSGVGIGHDNAVWGSEGTCQVPIPFAGTFKNMRVVIDNPPGAGRSRVFTLRVNGVNSILVVTISGAVDVTGSDLVNEVAVNAGDLVCVGMSVVNPPAGNCNGHGAVEFEGG